ncbi:MULTISPECIES: 2-aminoethylphosphonate aminotransferase [unclassified Caballeronia]|uniref:2-aminoethylphosphonate aminotransferase n=1 Tax=unclassified Caballeronia TaxID=2646786 RepID=UPI002855BB6F|nr:MULTISPECIES: 2-aminoethylphosphonate aminotransferase [unclassified Caballeronia]MDR5819576.1 2-aminoethylphosphonate aminotransferase [Caballeronia sp. LZ043]MDR5877344.1 2-aminoethylphosphonate aminotransferase [Caballeronia sp. LZ032]
MLLLNPGPVTLSERVRKSLLQTDLCHREPEFFDLQDEARRRLVAAYELDPAVWSAVLMTGSGTAAVESMIAGLVPEGGRLLIVENGVYGERIAQIAQQYGIEHEVVKHEWMQAPDIDAIIRLLDSKTFTNLAIIHHETTTGRLNALDQLSRACAERGVGLLLDAVSSFGAEAIDFDGGGIAAIAATANKCLHGVPGAAFVIARRTALAQAASRTYYLGIARLAKLQDQRNTPFTPSVHAYYALVEALREFEEEGGWRARHQRYARLAEQVRAGLAALGIESALAPEESSVVLRAYRLPQGVTYETLHDALKAKGFVIYAGQGGLSKELFRISTMGALDTADMDRLISSFVELLR